MPEANQNENQNLQPAQIVNAARDAGDTVRINAGASPFPAPSMPMPPRLKYHPVIETEADDDEVELEFTNFVYESISVMAVTKSAATLTELLNEGWMIEDKIICPPIVVIILSREKEEEE